MYQQQITAPQQRDQRTTINASQQRATASAIAQRATARPNNNVNFYNTKMADLDLNIDNYSLEDLFNLFNIRTEILDEDTLKNSKQIVLKMHPDKSHLDAKFFIFFKQAYGELLKIYEFQNKTAKKNTQQPQTYSNQEFGRENTELLNNLYKKQNFNDDKKGFNSWFNENFEKARVEDPNERGHGDWMRSNNGMIDVNENVSMSNMNQIIEQKKKQVQAMTVYTGIQDAMCSTKGASLLDDSDNFSGDYFTDLKEAYTETVIPVTMDDYNAMPKFNNYNEYLSHRESVDVKPISQQEGLKILEQNRQNTERKSQAIAYKYARQTEKAQEKQNIFWGALKQLTG